jgi:hypothetical protein
MTLAAIYLETFERLPAELLGKVPPSRVTPVDVQERACRAYCKRMGYNVYYKVFVANTDAPHAEVRWHLGFRTSISIEQAAKRKKGAAATSEQATGKAESDWRVWEYYTYDSKHPYHLVHNLLAEQTIDAIIYFTAAGESGLPDWAGLQNPPHFEYASLWEIEPPDEYERRMHELAEQVGKADSEEERRTLIAQMDALSAEKKAAKVAAARQAQLVQTTTGNAQASADGDTKARRKWYKPHTHLDGADPSNRVERGFVEGVDFGIHLPNGYDAYLTMAWYESKQGGLYSRLEAERAGWDALADSDVQAVLAEAKASSLQPDSFRMMLERHGFSSRD